MSRIASLALALLLSLPALAARPLEPPRANEKWFTLRADEFHFVSNVSPAKTLDVARDFLRMRAALGQLTRLNVRSAQPTTVFIFPNERTFGGYRDAVLQRKSDSIVGVFAHAETGNFILLRSDVEEIDRTVYHELTHNFVQNTSAGIPLWINEGIAEFYSTFRTSGSDVHIGRPVAEHVHWLRGEKLIPLPELFATTSESPIYNEGTRSGVFYAQSWALFHYLMADDDRRARFARFLQLLNEGRSADEAFPAAFAMKHAELEQELRHYVRRSTFTYTKYSLSDVTIAEPPKPEPMTHADVLFELGHLLALTDRQNAQIAERYLEESLAANPDNAAAHADLGRLHDVAGRRTAADAAYQKAVQLGSNDAKVYLLAALSLFERFSGKSSTEIPQAELRQARSLFQKSTELDPRSALAWAGLGATYIADPDPSPGITALEKSLALAPGNEEAAFHLVQLYANAGRHDDATRVFDAVLAHGSDAGMMAHAREALLLGEVRKLENLARERKVTEATALAKSILSRASNPSLEQYLEQLLQNLDRMAAAEAFNEAVAKANAGKYSEAIEIVDRVLPAITDPEMRQEATKFRGEVAARLKKK